jgi:hypothetical protein
MRIEFNEVAKVIVTNYLFEETKLFHLMRTGMGGDK